MPHPPKADSADTTADALRHALDRGKGGDKTDFIDPAAAPLGTDDEAAGHPPTREQVAMAAAAELGPHRPAHRPKPGGRTIPDRQAEGRYAIPVLLAAGLILMVIVVLLEVL